MRFRGLTLAAAIVLGLPGVSLAHHSRAHYAPEMHEIAGELVEINWRNPHASFELAVMTDSGEREVWHIESWSSPYVMTRMGVGRELFKVGDRVTIAGRRSSLQPTDLLAVNILFSDGHEAVLAASAAPYWSGEHVGGIEQWSYEATNPDAKAAPDACALRENLDLLHRSADFDVGLDMPVLLLSDVPSGTFIAFIGLSTWL